MKVAIVAMGPSKSEYLKHAVLNGGPYTAWDEVWAINTIGGCIKHDLMFHMDDVLVQELRAPDNPMVKAMLGWMLHHDVPIMTSTTGGDLKKLAKEFRGKINEDSPKEHKRALIGTARLLEIAAPKYGKYKKLVSYPLQEVLESTGASYLNGSGAEAVAYAVHRKAESITLFGFDYTMQDKHIAESGRACVELLVGIAKERGIVVQVPENSSLLDANVDTKFYGYDAWEVKAVRTTDGKVTVSKTPKDLPSAEEVELRYKKVPEKKLSPMPRELLEHLEKVGKV